MTVEPPPPAWYVLHTRSRFENVVRDGLERKSLEVFLPIVPVPSRRRDRRMMIRVPLFPGYVFVRSSLNPSEHLDILKTTGAVRLIGTTQGPVPVPREAIDSLRILVAAEQPLATGSRLRHGDRVVVVDRHRQDSSHEGRRSRDETLGRPKGPDRIREPSRKKSADAQGQ